MRGGLAEGRGSRIERGRGTVGLVLGMEREEKLVVMEVWLRLVLGVWGRGSVGGGRGCRMCLVRLRA